MSADLVMVQESVKLALDAADAAADVTAEYNKVKKENKQFLGRVKSIHRMSGLITIIAAVDASEHSEASLPSSRIIPCS